MLLSKSSLSSSTSSSFLLRFFFFVFSTSLLLLLSSPQVFAQKCVNNFNQTSEAKFCAPYVTYPYYLPAGPTDWIIESLLSYNAHAGVLQATLLPSTCEEKLIAYICASAYKRCDSSTLEGTPLERPLCLSVCSDVEKACSKAFEDAGQALPDCSNLSNSDSKVTVSTGGDDEEVVHVKCFSVDNGIEAPEFPFECGYPMNYDENAEPFPCSLQCPTPIISNEFLSAINWYARIMIPISSILILLFLGVQIYQYKFWMTYPRNYLVYNTGTVALSHVAYMVPVFAGGYEVTGCHNDHKPASNTDFGCNFVAWVLYLAAWGNCILFAIISTNVLVGVLQWNRPKVVHFLNIFYHFWMIVPPIVMLTVTQALGMLGFSSGTSLCLVDSSVKVDGLGPNNGLVILFINIPITTMLGWGYAVLLITLGIVFYRGGIGAVMKQTRLVAFLALYGTSLLATIIPTWEIIVFGTEPAEEYITCLVTNWVSSLFKGPQQHCERTVRVSTDPFFNYFTSAVAPTFFTLLVLAFFASDCYKAFQKQRSKSPGTGGTLKITGVGGKSGGKHSGNTTGSGNSTSTNSSS